MKTTKDLSTVFFFEGIFWGHFCSVFGFNPVKSDVDISLKFGLFTFQVNSDDLLRMRVVFRSMSEVKFCRGEILIQEEC